MKILVTIKWLIEQSLFGYFCKIFEKDPYMLEYLSEESSFELTEEQAKEIGISITY